MPLWLKTVLCILVIEVLGGLGASVTMGSIRDWYVDLAKPPGTPPNAIFGPVWVTLYALIGAALARIWHLGVPGTGKRRALGWFTAQMILNLAWTPIFFGWHRVAIALVVIVALFATIVLTIRAFRSIDRPAAWLMVPYSIWVAYATYLNAGFLALN